MSETESTQHPTGSALDAQVAEEAVHEQVIEQRTPLAPNLAPSEHRRTGALARLLARGSQEGTEVHAAMEDLDTTVDERVHRAFTPVVAAIEARFDVQDAKIDAQNEKIDAQNEKIETLTEAVRELTGAVAATNAKVEGLTATVAATNAKVGDLTEKVAAQNAKIGALYWMFGTLIALFMVLVALGVFNYLFPPPSIASGNSGPAPQTTSREPPGPPSEAGSVTPAPAATSREPTQGGDGS